MILELIYDTTAPRPTAAGDMSMYIKRNRFPRPLDVPIENPFLREFDRGRGLLSSTANGTSTTVLPTTPGANNAGSSTTPPAASSSSSTSTSAPPASPATQSVVLTSSYTAQEDLPAGVTVQQLLADGGYTTAKTQGLAAALTAPTLIVVAAQIDITSFEFSSRRLTEGKELVLPAGRELVFPVGGAPLRRLLALTVTTNFAITVPPSTTTSATDLAAALANKLALPATATAILQATTSTLAAATFSTPGMTNTNVRMTAAPTVGPANIPGAALLNVLKVSVDGQL